MRISADGGVPERLTRNGALYLVASLDNKTVFFTKTKNQSPLFALRIGGDERERVDRVRPRAAAAAGGLYYLAGAVFFATARFSSGVCRPPTHPLWSDTKRGYAA